jgi:hypothetical protein
MPTFAKRPATSAFSLRVTADLRDRFLFTAQGLGLNGADLLRQFMMDFSDKGATIAKLAIAPDYLDQAVKSPRVRGSLGKLGKALDNAEL